MRHLILAIFGFNTLIAGFCPMANAQVMDMNREVTLMCHSSGGHHGSITACSVDTKAATSVTQNACPDGSCIIRGTTGERVLSGDKVVQLAASNLPANFSQPVLDLYQGLPIVDHLFGPAPPGLERSEVLRS